MPVGTYSFTGDDLLDLVTLENYIGPPKATALKYLYDEDHDLAYDVTNGEFSL